MYYDDACTTDIYFFYSACGCHLALDCDDDNNASLILKLAAPMKRLTVTIMNTTDTCNSVTGNFPPVMMITCAPLMNVMKKLVIISTLP